MKKFLEQLDVTKAVYGGSGGNSEVRRKYQTLQAKYGALVGRRALYVSKHTKSSRVVTILGATDSYVLLGFKYYSMDGDSAGKTTAMFSSLICGDDRLEVEE